MKLTIIGLITWKWKDLPSHDGFGVLD